MTKSQYREIRAIAEKRIDEALVAIYRDLRDTPGLHEVKLYVEKVRVHVQDPLAIERIRAQPLVSNPEWISVDSPNHVAEGVIEW